MQPNTPLMTLTSGAERFELIRPAPLPWLRLGSHDRGVPFPRSASARRICHGFCLGPDASTCGIVRFPVVAQRHGCGASRCDAPRAGRVREPTETAASRVKLPPSVDAGSGTLLPLPFPRRSLRASSRSATTFASYSRTARQMRGLRSRSRGRWLATSRGRTSRRGTSSSTGRTRCRRRSSANSSHFAATQ
jgi:hypothetical protein